MPRVENLGQNVDEWYKTARSGSSTHDVCSHCNRILLHDPKHFKLQPYNTREPQGDKGWGGEVEHPDYEDSDYTCAACGRKLTKKDN
jgi:hypothetical protein